MFGKRPFLDINNNLTMTLVWLDTVSVRLIVGAYGELNCLGLVVPKASKFENERLYLLLEIDLSSCVLE